METKNLRDVVPEVSPFEDATSVRKDKKELVNKTINVLAHTAYMKGSDGRFMVILAEDETGGKFTTTVNETLGHILKQYGREIGYEEDKGNGEEKYFVLGCRTRLVQRISNANNKAYFYLE